MALTPFGNFTLDWTAKPTKISGQATNFKTWLNQRTEDIKAYINDTLLTQLGATADGASGGDQIGMTTIEGVAGNTVQSQMESIKAVVDVVASDIVKVTAVKTATITDTWVGASAPYIQEVSVEGITADDEPRISPVYSGTNATAILQQTAWNLIGKAVTGAGKITFTCFEEKPVTAIPIQIKGV